MPRPKVRPEDRKRSCKACVSCKASKIRCDSRLPCATCVRRGQSAACVYTGTDRRRTRHSEAISNQSAQSSEDTSPGVSQLVDVSSLHTPLGTLSTDGQPVASSSGRDARYSVPDSRPLGSSTKQKSICLPSHLYQHRLWIQTNADSSSRSRDILVVSSFFAQDAKIICRSGTIYRWRSPLYYARCRNHADRSGGTRVLSGRNVLTVGLLF